MKAVRSIVVGMGLAGSLGVTWVGDEPRWDYFGETGPENWAKLSPSYGACLGRNQSPINLAGFIEAELTPVEFSYQAGGTEVVNDGHTIKVAYAAGSSILLEGTAFQLRWFHFHAPSENQVEGESFPMEGHLVHADADGNLAIVAVMFTEGEANRALGQAWAEMPRQAGEKHTLAEPIAAADLLPADRSYYRFNGSLTTPPCTEGVHWLVMKRPVSASAEQIAEFVRTLGQPNNRPIQPTNARPVLR